MVLWPNSSVQANVVVNPNNNHVIITIINANQYRVIISLKVIVPRANGNQRIQSRLYTQRRVVPKIENQYRHNNEIYAGVSQMINLRITVYRIYYPLICGNARPCKYNAFSNNAGIMMNISTIIAKHRVHIDLVML